MTNFPPSVPNTSELPLADGTIIPTARYRLPAFDWGDFQVMVDCNAADSISQALHQRAFRQPLAFRILADLGKPGSRVLDLGAHIGTFTLLAAAVGCQVVAVEASPRNCALLQASVDCNHFAKVQVIGEAISDQVDAPAFRPFGLDGMVANAESQPPTMSVQTTTVDALLARVDWAQVDLIKMASEGSEVKAVAGMAHLLQQQDAPPILFAANAYTLASFGETPQRLLAALEHYGYRCYRVEPAALRLAPASTPQWAYVTDYLALKTTPHPAQWHFLPPLTEAEQIQELQVNARQPHEHFRAHVGTMLAQAEPTLLHERQVIRTLQALQADAHPAVRAAVAWWNLQDMPLTVRWADRVTRLRTRRKP